MYAFFTLVAFISKVSSAIRAPGEAVRVHRQFVHSRFLDAPGKALAVK
jgi:hypothetical protein